MRYTFRTPEGNKTLITDKSMTDEQRMELFMTAIFNKFHEWAIEHKHTKSARRFMTDCANYLIKDTNRGATLTPRKIDNVRKRELAMSSLKNGALANLLYTDSGEGEAEHYRDVDLQASGGRFHRSIHQLKQQELDRQRQAIRSEQHRYVHSRGYRMAQLYSTPQRDTYVIDQIGRERNVFHHPIVDARAVTVGGHQGIIGIRKPYAAAWCPVDTEGRFAFQGRWFAVSPRLRRYRVTNKWSVSLIADNRSAYGDDEHTFETDSLAAADWTNESAMDRILCYRISGHDHFFDQNINKINKKYIRLIESVPGAEER